MTSIPRAGAVLVTGAAGFVGSAVVRCLVRRLASGPIPLGGHDPIHHAVAVARPAGSRARLDELPSGPLWSFEEVDLADARAVDALFERVRPLAVVHTALDRSVHFDASNEALDRRVAKPLASLVAGLGRCGGVRFIHTGSAWVLPSGDALDEGVVPAPASPYARAKALEDRLLPEIAGAQGIEWLNLRLFNLYGRYEPPHRLIPYLVRELAAGRPAQLSEPDNVRDFTDVDLASEAFLQALAASADASGRTYHIGTGRGTTVACMAEMVTELVGGTDLLRYGQRATPDAGMAIQVADPSRAREMLGWNPPDDLNRRVRDVVRWWTRRMGVEDTRS